MTRSLRAISMTAAVATQLSLGAAGVAAQPHEAPAPPGRAGDGPPAAVEDPATAENPVVVDTPVVPDDPAVAGDPPGGAGHDPGTAGEDLAELAELSARAEALGEELHLAREELDRALEVRDQLQRAAGAAAGRADVAAGVAGRDQSRVDHLATMRYRGGDTGAARAAVLADSPDDLLRRLDALRRLSGATTSALATSRTASARAASLREEAARAAEAAKASAREASERTAELDRRAQEMAERVDEVRRRVDALSDAQRALWAGGPVMPEDYVAPPVDGVNSAALRTALTRLGAPYSWGATGPSSFDCSGLMVWAYAREGKALPRSSQAQAVAGAPVARTDIRPGDLVIYYPGATHVGRDAGDGLVRRA